LSLYVDVIHNISQLLTIPWPVAVLRGPGSNGTPDVLVTRAGRATWLAAI